ncbi:Papain fold toxin 1, glutamine deamidase [Streptomyces misionensis]|uniref:Papain fold toxin 1, glutamine deamidase n=1 Tax=Streptomyces misionensis TaxID=67331 RepID=A0A1H5AAQ3_9ACTN|nr:YrhB domain-containing protein [Streptomyces misionensis]SED39473.1 Papain fold toxin 1, glutamine deamidase [Streptomyces misionensis]
MMSREEAVAAAERYLRTSAYPERAQSVVMLAGTALWYPYGWTVCFDFREHLETGDPMQGPFSSLLVVPHDGTEVHFPPTHMPAELYLAQRAAAAVASAGGPRARAEAWLRHTYGALVEVAGPNREPVYETASAWLFACRAVPQPGFSDPAMLAASVVVPKDGGVPFHPSPSDPLADMEPRAAQGAPGRDLHARGCLVAVHCGIDGIPVSPLPWSPFHEAPGWWDRLARRYFPEFAPVPVSGWDDVIGAVGEPGPGTRGVVRVRRQIGGHEISGNLVYVHNNQGRVVLLDGLAGALTRLDPPPLIRELTLLRALPQAARRPAGG